MNQLKRIARSSLAAAALVLVVGVGSASATTLEIGGVTQNKSVELNVANTVSMVLSRTDGTLAATCTESRVKGTSESPFTGTRVTGSINEFTLTNCSAGNATVHQKGRFYIEHEAGTTNGKVFSEEAQVTFPTSLGFTVNCLSGSGTRIGTLTGTPGGISTIHVDAVLNCGFLLPSGRWKASYETVHAEGLGVSA